jgi:hypothetical protein
MVEEQRRHKRFTVEVLEGRMLFASQTRILNLSISGAAIETDRRLNPGNEYTLKLKQKGKALTLKGRIAWSVLSGSRKTAHGEMAPMYRAGMTFTDVMSDKTAALIEFIDENKNVNESRLSGLRFNIEPAKEAVLDFPYQVKKLSLGGMLIEAGQALSPDDRFQMEISPEDDRPVRFTGRVAYCNSREDDASFDIGIEFLEMDAESRKNLVEYVQSLYEE